MFHISFPFGIDFIRHHRKKVVKSLLITACLQYYPLHMTELQKEIHMILSGLRLKTGRDVCSVLFATSMFSSAVINK